MRCRLELIGKLRRNFRTPRGKGDGTLLLLTQRGINLTFTVNTTHTVRSYCRTWEESYKSRFLTPPTRDEDHETGVKCDNLKTPTFRSVTVEYKVTERWTVKIPR